MQITSFPTGKLIDSRARTHIHIFVTGKTCHLQRGELLLTLPDSRWSEYQRTERKGN